MNCKQCEFWDKGTASIKEHKGNDTEFRQCVNPVVIGKDGFIRTTRGGRFMPHGKFGCNYGERRREVKK